MIRTQIYLPKELHRKLMHLAKDRKQPMARLVRGFIEEGLNEKKSKEPTGKTVIENLLYLNITGGPQNLAQNIDQHLYGKNSI